MTTGAKARLLLLCLSLTWPLPLWADEGLDTVMDMLSRVSLSESRYREEKHTDMLDIPMIRSGQLSYRAPDFLSWAQGRDGQFRYEIHHQEMVAYRGGEVHQRLPLEAVPAASAFVESFRATLAGDVERLARHYRITFNGNPEAWHISLVPLKDEIGRFVERIQISGQSDHIQQIRIEETNGDWSLMQLEALRQEHHAG
jgi:hypothetical protein